MEQARGQLHWLDAMHAAGLYKDELAYPQLKQMAFEFELPLPLSAKSRFARAARIRELEISAAPAHRAADDRGLRGTEESVQWDEPISPG